MFQFHMEYLILLCAGIVAVTVGHVCCITNEVPAPLVVTEEIGNQEGTTESVIVEG